MLQQLIFKLQRLNWSIRYKEAMAFGLILVCFIANGCISILLLVNIKSIQQEQKINANQLDRLSHYQVAYKGELDTYVGAIFVSKNTNISDGYQDFILSDLTQQNSNPTNDPNSVFETNLASQYLTVYNDFLQLQSYLKAGNFAQAQQQWNAFTPDFDKVTTLLTDRNNVLKAAQTDDDNKLNSAIYQAIITSLVLTAFSILLALFLLFLIEKVLVQPLNRLQRALQEVAEGSLDQKIDILNRDEIGKLSESFRMAIFSLRQVLKGVQISDGLQVITQELAAVSRQQAEGASQQVTSLVQVIAAMQELESTAGRIADNSRSVLDLTGTTLNQINRVADAEAVNKTCASEMAWVVENTLDGVERIGQQVDDFSQRMMELHHQTESINKVVDSLNSIGKEVHLLSLNASIEAAGAGVYGERFKMLARQIRHLAGRANFATEEARSLISEVQRSSELTLNQILDGKEEVIAITNNNSNLRKSLNRLAESTESVNEAVVQLLTMSGQVRNRSEEISYATQQQYIASEQVINSARLAEQVAQETANASQEVAMSSSELENMSNQLSRVLGRVKLGV